MKKSSLNILEQALLPSIHYLIFIINCILFLTFIYYHDHGFDLTDEAYYALNATQHDNVIIGISFGYLTSYLISLFSCDFHDTRIIGYIILIGSTIMMTSSCINKYSQDFSYKKLLTAVSISTPCIIFYTYGIYSLSYNNYSVFGINFILTGLFLNKNCKIFSFPSFIAGIGIFLLGMSKFTIIPVFIFLIILMYFFYKDKDDLKIIFNGSIISIFLLLLHFFVSNDSIDIFIKRYMLIYENLSLLQSKHIDQFSLFFITSNFKEYILEIDKSLLIMYSICPIYLWVCMKSKRTYLHIISNITVLSIISFVIVNSLKRWVWHIDYVFLFYFVQFILISGFIKLSIGKFRRFHKLTYLLLAPFFYGLGSNSGISFGGFLTLFWPLIAIAIVYVSKEEYCIKTYIFFTSYILLMSLICAFFGFKHPYRINGRISDQSTTVTTINGNHDMVVETKLGHFVTELQDAALKNNWSKNKPLIELTNSPGLIFLLSGKIITTPWLLGSYEGSEIWSKKMLELYNNDDLGIAWIITAENKKESIPTNILNDVGLNFPTDYVQIDVGQYQDNRYTLWKPRP